jgi:prepilin-type N-terminal cleavage/methylation domain-containing protein
MKTFNDNRGFTLIELIVTAVIINILASVALVLYIGTLEKSRVATVIRNASSASAELQLWMQSSLSDRRNIREIDSNFDGIIDANDLTNEELLLAGVANTYVAARNSRFETSPWFQRPLWNTDDPQPNGTINVNQVSSNLMRITALEKNGRLLYEHALSAN